MPQASAYINKIRADAEGRNTKKEYQGARLNQNYLAPLMCTSYTQNGLFRPNWWVSTKYTEPCKTCISSITVGGGRPPSLCEDVIVPINTGGASTTFSSSIYNFGNATQVYPCIVNGGNA